MLDPVVRLRRSIVNDELSVVKMILRRYPDLLYSIDPKNGWSLLHYSSYYGRYLICVHLIQLRCDKDEIMTTFLNNTAVHLALIKGDEQTVHLLLQHFPVCINMKGQFGYTPVHFCCKYNYYQVLTLLLSCGAKLDVKDDTHGDYPLHVAIKYGNLDVAKILIQHGQNDSLRNKMKLAPSDVGFSNDVIRSYQRLLKENQYLHKSATSSSLMYGNKSLTNDDGDILKNKQSTKSESNLLFVKTPPLPPPPPPISEIKMKPLSLSPVVIQTIPSSTLVRFPSNESVAGNAPSITMPQYSDDLSAEYSELEDTSASHNRSPNKELSTRTGKMAVEEQKEQDENNDDEKSVNTLESLQDMLSKKQTDKNIKRSSTLLNIPISKVREHM